MGYFGHGWSKRYQTRRENHEDNVVGLERRGRSGILWVVGRSTLTAWSAGRDRTVLGSVDFPHDTWLVGAAVDAVGTRVLAADSSGILFSVRGERSDQLETSIWTAGNLDGLIFDGDEALDGRYPLQIRVDVEHQFDVEFSALTSADPHGCFLGTISGEIVLLSYKAAEKYRFNLRMLLGTDNGLEQIGAFLGRDDPTRAIGHDAAITALHYYAARSLLAIVTEEGAAVLLVATADTQPTARKGWWLRSADAETVAVDQKKGIVALGLSNGDIELMLVGYSPGERCQVLRKLSLSSWYFVPSEVGAVSQLSWSDDGAALAVGWKKQGLVIWSASGCRLVWTLPQVGSAVASTPTSAGGPREHQGGLKGLAWSPHGFCVWTVPMRGGADEFAEHQLLRSAILENPCQSEATRLAMLGADRMLLLTGVPSHETSGHPAEWHTVAYDEEYMHSNWPPKLLVINSRMTYAAVAGRRGFAICHVRTGRWRVFENLRQERSIRCCALAWLGRLLCVGVETAGGVFQLRLYSRSFLNEAAVRSRARLPSAVDCLDVRLDGHILVLCSTGSLQIFGVGGTDSSTVLTKIREVSLPTGLSSEISTLRIFRPVTQLELRLETPRPPSQVVMLKRNGTLALLDMATLVSVKLLTNVEHLWYTSSTEVPFDEAASRPLLWAYGADGLHVAFGHQDDGSDLVKESWFDWDPEVYPVGLTTVHGMFLGATQGLVFEQVPKDSPLSRPFSVVKVKQQPVLHRLLKHTLKNDADDRVALRLALRCINLPQFGDALEWLLYETVLEQDRKDAQNGSVASTKDGLLVRVIWLLKQFGEYEDIVVRCSRKMEVHWWPLLFKYTGDPSTLLEVCSGTSRLRTAACLLIILQEMFGYAYSTPHAIRLLEAAIGTGQLVLAAELSNFLKKAQEANMLDLEDYKDANSRHGELLEKSALRSDPSMELLPLVFALVSEKASKLLSEVNLRELGAMTRALRFPLAPWLKEVYGAAGPRFDPPKQLTTLHEQFSWPYPTAEQVDEEINLFRLLKNDATSGSPRPNRHDYRAEITRTEINFLQKAFIKAGVHDLALILSILLLDIDASVALMSTSPERGELALEGLHAHSKAYRHLAFELERELAEDKGTLISS